MVNESSRLVLHVPKSQPTVLQDLFLFDDKSHETSENKLQLIDVFICDKFPPISFPKSNNDFQRHLFLTLHIKHYHIYKQI